MNILHKRKQKTIELVAIPDASFEHKDWIAEEWLMIVSQICTTTLPLLHHFAASVRGQP